MTVELPSQRRYRQQLAEQERREGVRWSTTLGRSAAVRIANLYRDCIQSRSPYVTGIAEEHLDAVLRHSRLDFGTGIELASIEDWLDQKDDDGESATEVLHAMLEVILSVETQMKYHPVMRGQFVIDDNAIDVRGYRRGANDIFEHERISWLYTDETIVERGSDPMHAEVVEPLEKLLVDDPRFAAVSSSYGTALRHIAAGEFDSAITAMASALQGAFESVGARGNSLTDLAKNAARHGIIANWDEKIIVAIAGWANADRGSRGNAHGVGSGDADDARMSVGVIGAVIVRLSKLQPRERPE